MNICLENNFVYCCAELYLNQMADNEIFSLQTATHYLIVEIDDDDSNVIITDDFNQKVTDGCAAANNNRPDMHVEITDYQELNVH